MTSASAAIDDHALAAALATEAGAVLLEVRRDAGGRSLGAAGDSRAQAYLAEALGRLRPGDAVLSEEAADDLVRLGADRVWIIDPLDGTREFSEPPRDDWAVHVALWAGGDLVAGAVALPAQGVTLNTAQPPEAPAAEPGTPVRLVVSRSRPPAWVPGLVAALGAELVPMGSAGAKAMAVVQGRADAYVHAGGQYEWDSAAPVAVARAAGLHTSRIDGSPLRYNQANPWLPDLVICRTEVVTALLPALTGL